MNGFKSFTMKVPMRHYHQIQANVSKSNPTHKLASKLGERAMKCPNAYDGKHVDVPVVISYKLWERAMPLLVGKQVIIAILNHRQKAAK